jgi:hypothetical protein
MKSKLKSICLSRTNIFSVSLSIFLYLKDIKEVITGFASHLLLIGLSVIVLIGLLLINLFLTITKDNKTKNASVEDTEIKNLKANQALTNTPNKGSEMILAKFIFAIILFFAIMTTGSLYYVKNMGVYYVVLKNDLRKQEAINLMANTNSSDEFITHGLSSRILELPNDKYELILRNGYINEDKADLDLEKVKSLNSVFQPYKIGPQKVANYFKKIKYLQNDIFN